MTDILDHYNLQYYMNDPDMMLALCIWRESRNQTWDAKLGVSHVVKNRCKLSPQQGFKIDMIGNILKPFAFSSFNSNDPNSKQWPEPDDPSWVQSLRVARSTEDDPTDGAVFYFSKPLTEPPHAWGKVEHCIDIDELHFYKVA